MILYTIGFTQKSAAEFFGALKARSVGALIDTRINNTSQLAGFTKADDLKYFLKEIGNISYIYRPDFAPTKELLKDWRDKKISWEQYEKQYLAIQENRGTYKDFLRDFENYESVCILCSEATPEHCHRRLLAEKLEKEFPNDIKVIHI
ncbi:DUF488 domain-containing protein [Candidatus Saccharibacteria bacterium]|nr:DUF488 domain-containing protein [Candidatus Saccharibacteria bacterium]